MNTAVAEDPATRKQSPEASTFGSFNEAFIEQQNSNNGRVIWESRDKLWILAATELQAMKAWNQTRGPMIKKLSVRETHALVVQSLEQALKEANNGQSDEGELH